MGKLRNIRIKRKSLHLGVEALKDGRVRSAAGSQLEAGKDAVIRAQLLDRPCGVSRAGSTALLRHEQLQGCRDASDACMGLYGCC